MAMAAAAADAVGGGQPRPGGDWRLGAGLGATGGGLEGRLGDVLLLVYSLQVQVW